MLLGSARVKYILGLAPTHPHDPLIGESLGPYKIIERLGSGAMGEVYLANDPRLDRRVAIKVLPEQFADHPERLERFAREARAAAALNHPNIAAVFDVGFEGGTHFIVQEHLAGEGLRQQLERHALPLDQALRLGNEIASALSAAHAAGIVHRDIKPENVFVSDLGHAKVLDFGLAKLVEDPHSDEGDVDLSSKFPESLAGRIVGTPGYMAPEQVNGEPSDQRADVFAFGCMLYEMVSGKRCFAGDSAAESLSLVLREDPVALGAVDEALPLELCRIVGKCLQKDPLRRYQHADDLVVDLRALRGSLEGGTAIPASTAALPSTSDSRLGRFGMPAVIAATLLAFVATWAAMRTSAPEPAPVMRFSVNLPDGVEITRTERPIVDLSRDGQTMVLAANGALWVRALSDSTFTVLTGSEPGTTGDNAVTPTFSPDGTNIAFFLDGAILRLPLSGGAPISLLEAESPLAMHWGSDENIYYTQGDASAAEGQVFASEGIWRVAEGGGVPEPVVTVAADRRAAAPQLLPGDEWLLFSTTSAADFVMGKSSVEEIEVLSLRTGERRTLLTGGFAGRYVSTGHIVYVEDTSLWAVPFNLDGLEVTGGATRVIESVPMSFWAGTPYLAIADSGNLVVPELGRLSQRNGAISWVIDEDNIEPLDIALADNPRLSKDGTKIVAEVRGVSETRIWVHETDRGSWTELTTETPGEAPVWSADGRWVYFKAADSKGNSAIWRKAADFTSPAQRLWSPRDHVPYPESVPDDGRFLVYSAGLPDQNDIWLLWLTGDGHAIPLTETSGISEEAAQVHPSGRWIAYTSRESGRYEIYVQELSESGAMGRRFNISAAGGAEPMWSRDGRTLFYRVGTQLIAVDVELDPEFRAAVPRPLIREFPGDAPVLRADFDVAPDGRFITSIPQNQWNASRLSIVVNWFEASGLRR